jgi:protein phosphatase
MTLLLASAARATVGGRSGQEDAFRLWPVEGIVPPKADGGGLLAVLADGMGGHTGGAIAGQTACKTFAEVFASASTPLEARLKSALQASNEALAKGVEQNAALKGMGCTIVGAWIDDLGIRWTSVGDSLLLLYRLPDVIRLNADHSLGSFLDEQARQNKITRSEARRNRNRNALRSALTGSKIDLIDLRSEPLELRPGDWVLLASDGLCSLPGDEIADVVYRFRQSTPAEMADGLIAAVTQKGVVDQDNATVVAVRIDGAPEASNDVTTRVVVRPSKGEEVDLRTRRIGVSRRGPASRRGGGKTRAAVWLAAAVALAFCAVALMLAVPSLRPTMPSSPEAAGVPGAQPTTAPANAAVDPAPAALIPVKPSSPKPSSPKSAIEPPAQTPPPVPSPGKPAGAGEGQEGAAQPTPPTKSVATPPPTSPPASVGEGEPGAASRSSPSKPAASQPAPPAAQPPAPPPAEGEEGAGSRASLTKPSAPVPATKARPSGAKIQGTSPAAPAGKPAIPGESVPARQSKALERSRTKPAVEEPKGITGRGSDLPLSSQGQ